MRLKVNLRKVAKGIVLLILVLLCFHQSEAQTMTVGVKGGLNYALLYGENFPLYKQNGLRSFTGGIFYSIKSPHATIQTEVAFVKKGTRKFVPNPDDSSQIYTTIYQYDYIVVPFLVKIHLPFLSFYDIEPALIIGGALDIMRKATSTLELSGKVVGERDISHVAPATSGAAIVGIGFDIATEYLIFSFDGRFDMSLTNLVGFGYEVRTKDFSISAGFLCSETFVGRR